jgi:hypothetical protein
MNKSFIYKQLHVGETVRSLIFVYFPSSWERCSTHQTLGRIQSLVQRKDDILGLLPTFSSFDLSESGWSLTSQ